MSLPYVIGMFSPFLSPGFDESKFFSILLPIFFLGTFFLAGYWLVFRTNSILSLLKFDPEMPDEPLTFTVSAYTVTTIALILLGGSILINEAPLVFNHIYTYFETRHIAFQEKNPSTLPILISIIKIVIALLVIGERKRIATWAAKQADKDSSTGNE